MYQSGIWTVWQTNYGVPPPLTIWDFHVHICHTVVLLKRLAFDCLQMINTIFKEWRLTVIWLKLLLTEVRTISLQTSLLTWASVVKTYNRKKKPIKIATCLHRGREREKRKVGTYPEHSCHIWVNHSRTFSHSSYSDSHSSNLVLNKNWWR